MKQLVQIEEYEHKGVTVIIKINYMKEEISVVECTGKRSSDFKDKHWIFANRGSGYIESWCIILDAIKFAVKEANDKLKKYHETQVNEVSEVLFGMIKREDSINKKKK